jgi:hypothetical protein
MKNRNKIEEIGDPCGIPVLILYSYNSPSATLIVVFLLLTKLWTQVTIGNGTLRFLKLYTKRSYEI